MSRFRVLVACLALLAACRGATRAEVEASAETVRAEELARSRALAARLAREIAEARRHLDQELTAGDPPPRARCADDTLVRSAAAAPLVVRVRDVRVEARERLPLEFSASLASDDFAAVASHLASGRAALWDAERAQAKSDAHAETALAALTELRERRYRAELRVETFSAPRIFRRKDAPRSEWAAGRLAGRLVVADLVDRAELCQTPFEVRGDASEAPISRRLREVTRAALHDALADRAWTEMGRALSGMSSVLALPGPDARDAAEHRWARAPEASAALQIRHVK